jgi:hypothetical protein
MILAGEKQGFRLAQFVNQHEVRSITFVSVNRVIYCLACANKLSLFLCMHCISSLYQDDTKEETKARNKKLSKQHWAYLYSDFQLAVRRAVTQRGCTRDVYFALRCISHTTLMLDRFHALILLELLHLLNSSTNTRSSLQNSNPEERAKERLLTRYDESAMHKQSLFRAVDRFKLTRSIIEADAVGGASFLVTFIWFLFCVALLLVCVLL